MNVLVTGATGYVGGRLVPQLLARGHRVHVLTRDPARLRDRPWAGVVEVRHGDLLDAASLVDVAAGIDAAVYLVHSMEAGPRFADLDRRAAHAFADAARGLRRVVYLGGLQSPQASEHLRSRAEVGEILRERLPTLEFRAGPVIGSGSASFEIVRYLSERLPVMTAPRWLDNLVQPIGVRDVLAYLAAGLESDAVGVVDVGAEPVSFKEMLQVYAEERGLPRRRILKVPLLSPFVAAQWVGIVTPVPNRLAVPLFEAVRHPILADTARARELFPAIEPASYREAVRRALARVAAEEVETRWTSAGGPPKPPLTDREGLIREVREMIVDAPPARVFAAFSSLGGQRGWAAWDLAWSVRGWLDRLVGGPGLARGRRHPRDLWVGEAVDFWRVEELQPGRLLRLRAEMRVPGRAWLEFEAVPVEGGKTRLVQTALFEPFGLAGALYWYLLYPVHAPLFRATTRALAREAEGKPARRGLLRDLRA